MRLLLHSPGRGRYGARALTWTLDLAQGSMSRRAVADGVVAGCDVAALQASEMGRPIYERLSFQTVVRYAYVDPVPGA